MITLYFQNEKGSSINNNELAMNIGGQKDPRYLMAQHLARFADDTGIAPRTVNDELNKLITRLESEITALVE